MTSEVNKVDFCHGPILKKLLLFAIPLMLSSILQLLFNAADIIVVGRYAGSTSLAAVGSTTSLINLLTNLFIGLSIGVNVLIARYYGSKREKELTKSISTAIYMSLMCGLLLCFITLICAPPLLRQMGTPENVLYKASIYMRIYALGMPAMLLYNFGSAILRAVGDTKRPLYYLLIAGVLNVILNLIFVVIFRLDVSGVALATIISEYISALLVLSCLIKQKGSLNFSFKQGKFDSKQALQILIIGLPAGIEGLIFSISNVLIQSAVNSFGDIAIAGITAAASIEGFIYVGINAFYQASLTFTSQNVGAKKYDRIGPILKQSQILVILVSLTMGAGALLFARPLLSIYSSDATVIHYGTLRMQIICSSYFLCGIMDVIVGSIRGMGSSIMPTIVSLFGICGLRIIWLTTIFRWHPTLTIVYLSYPVSWIITILCHIVCYIYIKKRRLQSS